MPPFCFSNSQDLIKTDDNPNLIVIDSTNVIARFDS